MLAVVTGCLWNMLWPGVPIGAFALVGATAFLASSMRMPATAIVLMMEFSRAGHDFLIPMLLAVAGAVGTSYLFGLRLEIVARLPRDRTSTLALGEPLQGGRGSGSPDQAMH